MGQTSSPVTTIHSLIPQLLRSLSVSFRYHTILLHKVKPLHKKCQEIERDLLEQDQKLLLLENKNQVSQPVHSHSEKYSLISIKLFYNKIKIEVS